MSSTFSLRQKKSNLSLCICRKDPELENVGAQHLEFKLKIITYARSKYTTMVWQYVIMVLDVWSRNY